MSNEDRQGNKGFRRILAAPAARLRAWLPTYSHWMFAEMALGFLISCASTILISIILNLPDPNIGNVIEHITFIYFFSSFFPFMGAFYYPLHIVYVLAFFILFLAIFKITVRLYRVILLAVAISGWEYYGSYWLFLSL